MAEIVRKVLVHIEVNAEVEILGVKDEDWGTIVFARVKDISEEGLPESGVMAGISEAVTIAYMNKFEMPPDSYRSTKAEAVLPSLSEPATWYAHIRIFRQNTK